MDDSFLHVGMLSLTSTGPNVNSYEFKLGWFYLPLPGDSEFLLEVAAGEDPETLRNPFINLRSFCRFFFPPGPE